MPSVFVTEMQRQVDGEQLLCPRCKKGRLKSIKDGVSINGNQYRNYLCSNSVAGCHFFWQIYYDDESDIPRKYHRQMDQYFIEIEDDFNTYVQTNKKRISQRVGHRLNPPFPAYMGPVSTPPPPIEERDPDELPF